MNRSVTDRHLDLQLFAGYQPSDIEIFREFAKPDLQPEPGFVTDFIGSRIRTTSVWKEARTLDGALLGPPEPADFHAEAVEWIGLLKAVRDASDRYCAMELGAGFGPWSVAGALAAQSRGIQQIRLYAVEGDSNHYRFLRQHFLDNGLNPDEHMLFEAAVGAHSGGVEWPVGDESDAAEDYGCRPIDAGQNYTGRPVTQTKKVPLLAMRDLLLREPEWDLIHIDVQGHEVEICRSCIDELSNRVRWMIVGTHSRKLDGDLLELMYSAGWVLAHEKPCKFQYVPGAASLEAMTTIDGTQIWSNPRRAASTGNPILSSFDQAIKSGVDRLQLKPGEERNIPIVVINTGSQSWFTQGSGMVVVVGYRWLDAERQLLPMEGSRGIPAEAIISPGQSAAVNLAIRAPDAPGRYFLSISMVQEGVAWFWQKGGEPLLLEVNVQL